MNTLYDYEKNRAELNAMGGHYKRAVDCTDSELSHEMSECRIAIESIRPYRFRHLEIYRHELESEWANRAAINHGV